MNQPSDARLAVVGMAVLIALVPLAGQTPRSKVEPLADVNGVPITADEVNRTVAAQIVKLEEQIYQLQSQRLETIIREKLLAAEAARRGVSVQALLDKEVTSKVALITEQEIEAFYQANKTRLQGEEATVREQIRTHLQNQKLAAQREAFIKLLRSQARVAVYLKPPPVFRVDVGIDGAPSRGPASAPVTVVEFSDFHCPFCREAENTLAQVQSRFPDKVRLIFRDFPIDQLHPRARPAHEAARCAGEQGKFWEYHNALFVGSAKSPDQLTRIAQDVGLNAAPFDQCVTSGKYRAAVQKDIDEGTRLGVTGTPSFFINGRMLTGAQPIETFVGVIENELSRAAQQSAAPR